MKKILRVTKQRRKKRLRTKWFTFIFKVNITSETTCGKWENELTRKTRWQPGVGYCNYYRDYRSIKMRTGSPSHWRLHFSIFKLRMTSLLPCGSGPVVASREKALGKMHAPQATVSSGKLKTTKSHQSGQSAGPPTKCSKLPNRVSNWKGSLISNKMLTSVVLNIFFLSSPTKESLSHSWILHMAVMLTKGMV